MTSGIYKLSFGPKVYIGRSLNIEQRYRGHLSDIKAGKSSKKLINALAEYGEPKLEILCEEPDLTKQKTLEIEYIRNYNSYMDGLNSTIGGEDVMYGELNNACKYTNEQLKEVLTYLANKPHLLIEEISEITGVSRKTVAEVSAGAKHLWLKQDYPELHEKMLGNKHIRKEHSLSNLTDKFRFKPLLETLPVLISPEGLEYSISGSISEFARTHGLQLGNLSSVINGRRKSHKGWKLKESRVES